MTSRNIIINTLNIPSRSKPAQSQSPLHKKKYYKFVIDSSKAQAEQTLQDQKPFESQGNEGGAQKEKKEEFKKEIERRFNKSAVNPSYQFPRHKTDLSDTMSEGSVDSLERLSTTVKYDLHSQNLRYYAKTQAKFSIKDTKSDGNPKPTRLTQPLQEIAIDQSDLKKKIANNNHNQHMFQTFDHRLPDQPDEIMHRTLKDAFSDLRHKPVDKAKLDLYFDQNTLRSEETPATTDTAFSTFNRANPNTVSSNFPTNFLQSNKFNTVQQFAPSYQPLTTLNNRRTLDSKITSSKDVLMPPQAFSTRTLNLANRQSTTAKRTTPTNFFHTKNAPNSKIAGGSQKGINSKKIIDVGLLNSNQNYGIYNPIDLDSASFGKDEALTQRTETAERASTYLDMPDSMTHKIMFGTFDGDQKTNSRGQSRNQLRNTSNLYNRTQNDLLKKIKSNEIEHTLVANLTKYSQGSVTNKVPSRPVGSMNSKVTALNLHVPAKAQNIGTLSPQIANIKNQAELRVPKLDIARTIAINLKTPLESEGSTRQTPRQPQLDKGIDRTINNFGRSSYSRGFDSKIETSVLKLDLKSFGQKSGAKTDRGKVDSIIVNSNYKRIKS